jgi:hypothetical protein
MRVSTGRCTCPVCLLSGNLYRLPDRDQRFGMVLPALAGDWVGHARDYQQPAHDGNGNGEGEGDASGIAGIPATVPATTTTMAKGSNTVEPGAQEAARQGGAPGRGGIVLPERAASALSPAAPASMRASKKDRRAQAQAQAAGDAAHKGCKCTLAELPQYLVAGGWSAIAWFIYDCPVCGLLVVWGAGRSASAAT